MEIPLEQEINQAMLELWLSMRNQILMSNLPRYLFIANKSGRPVSTVPRQSFTGLDAFIHTGQNEEEQ